MTATRAAAQRLAGRRLLITGGAAGIGRASAARARDEGAQVFILDRDAAVLQASADEIGCGAQVTDVRDEAAVNDAIAAAVARMGGLDGVVNAAGIMLRGSIGDVDAATWRNVLEVNLTGPYLVLRAAMPYLLETEGPAVVNIASGQALLPNSADRSAYSASKGGLLNLTRALAAELAPRVRVNSVCPGLVDTTMADGVRRNTGNYAMRRLASTDEIASAILFLLSDEASYITGAALAVDGGRSFH